MKEIAKQHLNNEHLARKMCLISKERVLEEMRDGRGIFSDMMWNSLTALSPRLRSTEKYLEERGCPGDMSGRRTADKEIVQTSSLFISVFSEFFSASHANDKPVPKTDLLQMLR